MMNSEKISHKSNSLLVTFFSSVIIPLSIGALIYMLSRERSIYFLKFLPLNFEKVWFPDWVRFNLPDGLWAFSFSSLIAIIWRNDSEKSYYLWLIFTSVISILFEILYGTFDNLDIIFVVIGLTIPALTKNKKNYILKNKF